MQAASPPAGSMSRLPSGWPATCRRRKPRASKRPVRRICIASEKGPRGVSMPPAMTSAWSMPSVGIGAEAGVEFGPAGEAAGRDVRHDREALAREAPGGGEHLGEVGAVDMGEVDARALGQDGAEVLDLRRRARHDLDGEVPHQRGEGVAGELGRRRPADEVEDFRHRSGSGSQELGAAQPSFSIRALIASGLNSASMRAASPEATSTASPSTT